MTVLGLDFDLNTVLVAVVVSALVYAVGSAITYTVHYLIVERGKKSGHEILPETHNGAEEMEKGEIVPCSQPCEGAEQVFLSEDDEEVGGDGDEKGEEREEGGGEEGKEEHQPEQEPPVPNDEGQIIRLTISDGQLVVATIEKTAYYFCRKKNGVITYNLNDDEKINKKAIYNHEAVIDIFCDKTGDSVLADKAKIVKTIEGGVLDSDYKVLKKALVKFE